MKRNKSRAGAALAVIALLGSMGVGGLAHAAPAPKPQVTVADKDQSAANPALIKKDATTQLSIHKYLGTPVEAKNNGTIQKIEDRTPLQNVQFDLYKVENVDLTTNKGWEAAKALYERKVNVADLEKGVQIGDTKFTFTEKKSGTTDASGEAKIQAKVGLYLVVENLSASKDIKGGGKTYTPAQITGINPFLVTLPMTNPDSRDSWMYDVHVYPKNQAAEMTKAVIDGNQGKENQDGYKIGQNITYRLESTINVVDSNQDGKVDGDDLGYYLVKDQLSEHVKYVSSKLSIIGSDNKTVELLTPQDYAFTNSNNLLSFSITKDGLNKLAKAAGGKLQTEIVTAVTTMPITGQVKNKASFYPNNYPWTNSGKTPPTPGENPPPGDTPPDVPSNEVVSKYGDVVIKKINADKQPLAGAEFAVFRATKESDAAGYTCKNVDFSKEPIAKTAAASDAGGLTIVRGLQLSNWRNDSSAKSGAITDEKQFYSYCLVETKSPDGYQLLAEPIEFNLLKEGAVMDLSSSEEAKMTDEVKKNGRALEVVNQPDNLKNKLPLTGGEGIALVSVLGILLVGGGAGYYIYANRRKDV
ncbi:SpaH/EbpB family LPXTG-anchored major pilin [Trueperella pyogenes]|uniref:SpaH/EbpB family LPXTG-anchored major pilin n=1 Tax=Trueperella pyogenes TaxID=1661 RepID=UPI000F8576E6|nr:SpaH/EbpB family LPXTG-anchored major pilin [Trueperella pyogenes]AZR01170.1 LPXTG cell wall anchor domain-containing protein [Trueperella pyogenes]AZR02421.1 LPXTG cell wall anchor domain-containing protein [Trueperella pyogenes]